MNIEYEEEIYQTNRKSFEIIIKDPQTKEKSTANDLLSRLIVFNGSNGINWESEQDIRFRDILLERALVALSNGDVNKLDLYLCLDYWNPHYIHKMVERINELRQQNQDSDADYCSRMLEIGNNNKGSIPLRRCKALYFVLWNKNVELLEYVLNKIHPWNIMDDDLHFARFKGLGKFICDKDPSRYYMDKLYFGGELIDTPMIRTAEQQAEYFQKQLQRKLTLSSKYEALLIHKYAKRTKDNVVLTKWIPDEVMRYIISMI